MVKSKYGLLSSSADSQKLALTVKGILLAVVPVVLLVARSNGVDVTEGELVELVAQVVAVVSAVVTLLGLGRKLKEKIANC